MAGIHVRPAGPGDAEKIRELLEHGLKEQERYAAQCDPPESEGFFEAELREHLAGLDSEWDEWIVAEGPDGDVIGCLWLRSALDRLGAYATVRQVIVDPAHRRRGVGGALVRRAEDLARSSGVLMMLISSLRPNPAVQLYRALGFTDFPEGFREDENPEHVVLWKPFKSPFPIWRDRRTQT